MNRYNLSTVNTREVFQSSIDKMPRYRKDDRVMRQYMSAPKIVCKCGTTVL